MGMSIDLETAIAIACAICIVFLFWLALALSQAFGNRRFKRRLSVLRDRAQGNPLNEAVATRSLARQQTSASKIDRIAHRWLPRCEILAARLAATGREISVGKYAMACVGLALASTLGFALALHIGFLVCLLLGALIGT